MYLVELSSEKLPQSLIIFRRFGGAKIDLVVEIVEDSEEFRVVFVRLRVCKERVGSDEALEEGGCFLRP